jgi:hypothetical protein
MRACAILAALFAAPLALAADEKPAIKEIPTKDLKLAFPERGKATEPATITSAEDLAKNAVVKGAADEIKKQVDFSKEKLVVFAWGGSGRDRLTPVLRAEDKKATAVFSYAPGLTRDFRMHTHLYVVPKDAEVKVEPAAK